MSTRASNRFIWSCHSAAIIYERQLQFPISMLNRGVQGVHTREQGKHWQRVLPHQRFKFAETIPKSSSSPATTIIQFDLIPLLQISGRITPVVSHFRWRFARFIDREYLTRRPTLSSNTDRLAESLE
jgi:hypothetical protein